MILNDISTLFDFTSGKLLGEGGFDLLDDFLAEISFLGFVLSGDFGLTFLLPGDLGFTV